MPIKVQKKDGQQEDFDRNKVVGGLAKSGATPDQVEEITKQVEVWVTTAAVNGVINSFEIRAKVLELLRAVNPSAITAFENYQKPVEPTPTE